MAPRRRRKPEYDENSKDLYVVLDAKGATVKAVPGCKGCALLKAQSVAERGDDKTVLTVERRSLFGTPTPLYRVRRDGKDTVTFTISEED